MKIDIEYMKKLLVAFEAAKTPVTNLEELEQNGIKYQDDVFHFHFELFVDEALVEKIGNPYVFGANRDSVTYFCGVHLRLTSKGHDFLKRLRDKNVWGRIKSDFKDNSISGLIDIAKMLGKKYAKKKINKLME